LALAEDAAQDAFAAAAVVWPRDGVPPKPSGWLMLTAQRKAIDRLRREATRSRRDAVFSADREVAFGDLEDEPVTDDRLQLIFMCAHPALAVEARIALTLRCIAGLDTREIARAFLVSEPAMAQRIVRAKRRIRDVGIPFRLPSETDLAERLDDVLSVVYLIFNEGYAATSGEQALRHELCDEAIRLGRLLRLLVPSHPETAGLLALMLLHHARAKARIDGDKIIALDEQDRSRWDHAAIAEGVAILDDALRAREPGPYQVQAAIAALHSQAASIDATDWPQIATLYGVLSVMTPSPVVEVNRAVAVAMADGPAAGLRILEPLLGAVELANYAPLYTAHADLLRRNGDRAAAAAAYRLAAGTSGNDAQRRELQRRADELKP
jgi:RNA polymerase sigma-70 factor, ECF subfamily